MILPIGDMPNPRGFVPWVTWLLLAVNVFVHLFLALPASLSPADPSDPTVQALFTLWSDRVPADGPALVLSEWDVLVAEHGFTPAAPSAVDLLSALFMHANLAHLFGNLLFLWIYGDNVEHRLGRIGMVVAYLGTGTLSTLAYGLVASDPAVPLIGASGAISGVLGIYFVLFPRNQVRLFVALFPFILDVWLVPAPFVLGAYVVLDNLLPFLLSSGSSVAYGAHLGGFFAGLAVGGAVGFRRRTKGQDPALEWVDEADALAAQGQVTAAFNAYVRAMGASTAPEIQARARSGLVALDLDPRLAARLGL